jgi:hypothetical protein
MQLLPQNSRYKSPLRLRLRCKSWIVQIVLLSSLSRKESEMDEATYFLLYCEALGKYYQAGRDPIGV